jgi:hypothetical protein
MAERTCLYCGEKATKRIDPEQMFIDACDDEACTFEAFAELNSDDYDKRPLVGDELTDEACEYCGERPVAIRIFVNESGAFDACDGHLERGITQHGQGAVTDIEQPVTT